MGRVIRYTIAVGLGALIAWAIMEPTSLMPDVEVLRVPYSVNFTIGLILGALMGLFFGLSEAVSGLSPRFARKIIVLGTMVGCAGGILGLTIGAAFYGSMLNLVGIEDHSFRAFLLCLIGRSFGWALIGLCIGIAPGLATGSTKRLTYGAIGGFIGSGIGGIVLESLKWMNMGGVSNFHPAVVRMLVFAICGCSIGFLVGCAEELAKRAWLVKLVGYNEGKSIDLFSASTVIGRSELADIPVFSDPDVAERHAVISVEGRVYMVQDMGSAFGTYVNGNKVTREYLNDGDVIMVGKTKFVFRDKMTSSASGARAPYLSAGSVQIPTSQHVCPFCGSPKDAAGNCDCSVSASKQSAPAPVSQPTMVQQPNPAPAQMSGMVLTGGSSGQQGPRLVALSGPYSGQMFAVRGGETHIGRDDNQDISLSMDSTVSRNHARIAQEVTSYVIYDTGSTNGTYVSGQRINRQEIRPGDMIQIGNSKFQFEI